MKNSGSQSDECKVGYDFCVAVVTLPSFANPDPQN